MTIYPSIAPTQLAEYLMTPLETKNTNLKDETERLVEGCLRDERQAQMKVYQKYYNQVFAVCLRYSNDRDEAKSLVNAAFLKSFQAIGKYNFTGSLGGWINRIAINTCIDEVRKRNNALKHTVSTDNVPETAIPDSILDSIAAEDILAAIQRVTPVSRTVFCLYVIDGFKHAEIATMLNIQEGTSRWHLNNAKKELQVLLKNYENQ
jgi:RNA polymerase sigma factor (sigma-70 family)